MRKNSVLMVALLVLTTTLAGCLGGNEEFDTSELDQQIADLQQNQNEMTQTNTELRELLESKNVTIEEKEVLISSYLSSIDLLNQQVANSLSNVSDLEAQLSDAENYRDSLLILLEDANTTSDELQAMIDEANANISSLEADLIASEALAAQLQQTAYENLADLSGSVITHGNLSGVDLSGADLSGIDWTCVDISGANLANANLSNATIDNGNYIDPFGDDEDSCELASQATSSLTGNMTGVDMSNSVFTFVDLSGADLSGADLSGADWTYVKINGANLSNSNLTDADLYGLRTNETTDLSGIITSNTKLYELNIDSGEYLGSTDFSETDLKESKIINLDTCPIGLPSDWNCLDTHTLGYILIGPHARIYSSGSETGDGYDLSGISCIGCNFTDILLTHSNLASAYLPNSNFTDAFAQDVIFSFANLSGTDFTNGNFMRSLFDSTNLSGAILSGSSFNYADFIDTDFSNADLSNAYLSDSTLQDVIWDNTICPDGTNSDDNGNTCMNNLVYW